MPLIPLFAALFAVFLAAISASSIAHADHHGDFLKADLNKDGVIDQPEYRRTQDINVQRYFIMADRDNDGRLTPQEFRSVALFLERKSYREAG